MGRCVVNVCGIDYSTRAIDLVLVPLDDGTPAWHRYPLGDAEYAFERTRMVGEVMPGRASSFWDSVLAVGLEEPAGRNTGYAFCVQGAILSQIPARMLVTKFMPSEWRKAVGLPGNASKSDVADRSFDLYACVSPDYPNNWPQDAHDAHLIALATRQAIAQEQAA